MALLGEDKAKSLTEGDKSGVIQQELSASPRPKELRAEMPLWKAIEEYLKVAKEARVGEIQIFLDTLNMKGISRQAIESALKRHWLLFTVRKSGKEKFISLGNVSEFAATYPDMKGA